MNTHFMLLDWVVLGVYFAATMAIGFCFYRKSRTADAFTVAGRSLPGWVCGLSIFATYLSSISFLALPGAAFATNWNGFVFSLSLPIATIIAVRWFMPFYRSSGEVSAYAHLEKRFGPWARFYAGSCYLLTQIARMGMVMYLMALPISVLIGWDIRAVILITGVSVTVYAFVGGVVAVIWNDALQAVILIVGALACVVVMLLDMPEGPGQVFTIAQSNDKFSLGSFDVSLVQSTFWLVLLYGVTMNLQNFGIDQSYVQRYIASRSDREARKSVWLGGMLYVPVSAMFFFIGTCLFAYYSTHPEDLIEVRQHKAAQVLTDAGVSADDPQYATLLDERAAAITDAQLGDAVFPHFIGKKLPVGVTGLLIAAVFSAGMSTVSTSLNSSATLLLTDWYKRLFVRDPGEQHQMFVLHACTVALGIIGTALALVLVRYTQGALDMWWTLSGIFAGGMVGLFLLGLISRRATSTTGLVAVISGVALITWMTLSRSAYWPRALETLRNPLHAYATVIIGTITILVVGFAISASLPRRAAHVVPREKEGVRL